MTPHDPSEQVLLCHAVLNALFNCLREAHSRRDVKAIVVTGSNNRFSAGFDIAEFAKSSGGGGIDSRRAPHPLILCQHGHEDPSFEEL